MVIHIYIASEEKKVVDLFKESFPGMILENNRTYYDEVYEEQNLDFITQVSINRENDNYWKGIQYMSSLVLHFLNGYIFC